MRLSGWRARAPQGDSMDPKVLAVVEPVGPVAIDGWPLPSLAAVRHPGLPTLAGDER
jgi:hypothetical protein